MKNNVKITLTCFFWKIIRCVKKDIINYFEDESSVFYVKCAVESNKDTKHQK